MELLAVNIDKPEDTNFILGQSHFIKTVEDLHEALVGAVPGIRFGLAFCEASGKRLVRSSGTDAAAQALAEKNAMAIGAGHSFIIVLGDGFFPVNVLNTVKAVPEVCRIFCATANPTQVLDCADGSGARDRGRRGRLAAARRRNRRGREVASRPVAQDRVQGVRAEGRDSSADAPPPFGSALHRRMCCPSSRLPDDIVRSIRRALTPPRE